MPIVMAVVSHLTTYIHSQVQEHSANLVQCMTAPNVVLIQLK